MRDKVFLKGGKKKFKGKLIIGLFLFSISFILLYSETVEINILHTNDILGQIKSYRDENGREIGGAQKLGYFILSKSKEFKKLLILDSGNALGPDRIAHHTKGVSQIKIMNYLGYKAIALGEMEFIYGPQALKKCMQKASFPFLSCNVIYKNTNNYFVKPYDLVNIKNIKIGIIGVTEIGIPLEAYGFKDLEVDYPDNHLSEILEKLKEKKCDLIILLSNLGEAEDRRIAKMFPEIDIILGGNIRTKSPSQIYNYLPQDVEQGICIFYSTPLSISIGEINIEIEKKEGKSIIKNIEINSYLLNENLCPSEKIAEKFPEFNRFIENIIKDAERAKNIIIGEVYPGETIDLSTLTLLLMQKTGKTEIALCDIGLFGWFHEREFLIGKIRSTQIDEYIPFDDHLMVTELNGMDLFSLFNYHKDLFFSPIINPFERKINENKIKSNEKYSVAVNSYLISKYDVFKDKKLVHYKNLKICKLVQNYIIQKNKKR